MAGNTIGELFKVTTFGESHGPMIGVVVDGCPAGVRLDDELLAANLRLRRPGQSHLQSARREQDQPQWVGGVFEGQTTGTPLAALIANQDARSQDYDHLQGSFRPSHADYTYQKKYGIRDHRGGGRASARETVARVVAGSVAQMLLRPLGISICAAVTQVGSVMAKRLENWTPELLAQRNATAVLCSDEAAAQAMILLIEEAKAQGDSLGGVISGVITGVPVGLGEPVFDRLHADLGKAMLSINAVKGFEVGSGFAGCAQRGSQQNDLWVRPEQTAAGSLSPQVAASPLALPELKTLTNHSGGIQGGISNGMPITFRVAFKPTSSLMQSQSTVTATGASTLLPGSGRHDPCVLPRAVVIVEAMAAIIVADHWLRQQTARASDLRGP